MTVEVRVPEIGESIRQAQIAAWHKQEGQRIDKNESLVELETDKATVQLPSPVAGTITRVLAQEGEVVNVGSVIARLDESPRPADLPSPAQAPPTADLPPESPPAETAPGGRPASVMPVAEPTASHRLAPVEPGSSDRREEVVPMTMIRRRIAQRLVQAQQQAALVTTFNDADLSAVIELRKRYRDAFQERYHTKLGFMSFFVKAAIEGLKRFPQINAEIRDDSIVYHNYYDIGIAVGSDRGLVVPVLRDAERMSFAEIEQAIGELAERARNNTLTPDELQGGTFTITNGGIYGSMLSTPIVNPPQSGILGLHAIQDRPVARDGQVVIRPMMYLALSYDHRIVDGREAVGFLRTVKEIIEEPARLVLEV